MEKIKSIHDKGFISPRDRDKYFSVQGLFTERDDISGGKRHNNYGMRLSYSFRNGVPTVRYSFTLKAKYYSKLEVMKGFEPKVISYLPEDMEGLDISLNPLSGMMLVALDINLITFSGWEASDITILAFKFRDILKKVSSFIYRGHVLNKELSIYTPPKSNEEDKLDSTHLPF